MKKVLFYFNGIYNGGTEIESFNLMKKIQNKYEIYFTCNHMGDSDRLMLSKIKKVGKYISVYKKNKFDTVIFCTHAIEQISIINENIVYDKSYFWYHYSSERQNEFLKMMLNDARCNAVIAVSKTSKKILEQQEFVKRKKIKLLL